MLRSLQAGRAVAALLVVLFHASNGVFDLTKYFGQKPHGQLFDVGGYGVNFFFVLSGFLMMHVHYGDFGKPHKLGTYLWKRFSRIYPTYWVALSLIVPVFFVVRSFGRGHETNALCLLSSYALFPLPHLENVMILSVAWTLVYEVFFYLVFSLPILHRRIGTILLMAWASGAFFYPVFTSFPASFIFSPWNLYFLAGIAVAWLHASFEFSWPRLMAWGGAGLFFATAYLDVYGGPLNSHVKLWGLLLGCALCTLGLVQADRRHLLHVPAILNYLGNASYSIYLVHFPALSILAKVAKGAHLEERMPLTILFWSVVAGAIAAGCVFHHLVERPIVNWAKRKSVSRGSEEVKVDSSMSRRAA